MSRDGQGRSGRHPDGRGRAGGRGGGADAGRGRPAAKRFVAVVLLVSAFAMILAAALMWTGIIPVASDVRTIVGVVLLAAGLVDLVLGLKFLQSSA